MFRLALILLLLMSHRIVEMTVPSAQVGSGGVSDFSVLLNEVNLPAEIFTHSNGTDIKAWADSGQTTQYPVDIIHWDGGGSKVQIRVKLPSLSSAADNDFFISYGNGESLPASSDTYGRFNAYDASWAAYWPMQTDPASGAADRTSNGRDLVQSGGAGSLTNSTGKIGNAVNFDGVDKVLGWSGTPFAAASGFSAFMWAKYDSGGGTNNKHLLDIRGSGSEVFTWRLAVPDLFIRADGGGFTVQTVTVSSGNWRHYAATCDGTNNKSYENAGLVDTDAWAFAFTAISSIFIGGQAANANLYKGDVDVAHLHTDDRSAAWITTEYNQTNDPASFATAGTPGDVGGGGGSILPLVASDMADMRDFCDFRG